MGLGEKIGIYWPVCLNLVVVESDVSCNTRPDQAKVKVLRLVLRHSPFCRCVKIFLKKTRKQKRTTRFLILTRDERKKKTSSQTLEEKRGRWTKKRSRQFVCLPAKVGGRGKKLSQNPVGSWRWYLQDSSKPSHVFGAIYWMQNENIRPQAMWQ